VLELFVHALVFPPRRTVPLRSRNTTAGCTEVTAQRHERPRARGVECRSALWRTIAALPMAAIAFLWGKHEMGWLAQCSDVKDN